MEDHFLILFGPDVEHVERTLHETSVINFRVVVIEIR